MALKIESAYPIWLVLPLVALAIFIVWFVYFRKNRDQNLPDAIRYLLGSIRFLVLFVLGLLIISPWIRMESGKPARPEFIIALDNSLSMSPKDSIREHSQRTLFLNQAEELLTKNFIVRKLLFGQSVREDAAWNYTDRATQAGELGKYLVQKGQNRDFGGVLLVTDGVITQGQGWHSSLDKIPVPVFVLGTGDSTNYPDVRITELLCPEWIRKNTLFQVRVFWKIERSNQAPITLTLSGQNGTRQTASITPGDRLSGFYDFELKSPESGSLYLTASIGQIEGEKDFDNNIKRQVVKIIGREGKIIAVYDGPHPDIQALSAALKSFPQLKFEPIDANAFTEIPEDCDLLILHNVPSRKNPLPGIIERVRKMQMPVLFIAGIQTDPRALLALGPTIDIRGFRKEPEAIQGVFVPEFNGFTLPENLSEALSSWPPIDVAFETFNTTGSSQVLLKQKIRNIEMPDPLMFFTENSGNRFGVIGGEGIWRWRIYEYLENETHETFDELFGRIIQYLIRSEDDQRFRLQWPEEPTERNPLRVTAFLKNSMNEAVNEPDVQLAMTDSTGRTTVNPMSRVLDHYEIYLQGYPAGRYSFKATTQMGEERLEQTGEITILPHFPEQKYPVSKFADLRDLAVLTGGFFTTEGKPDELLGKLESLKGNSGSVTKEYKWIDLINVKFLLWVLAGLLSLEWFLRRWHGTR